MTSIPYGRLDDHTLYLSLLFFNMGDVACALGAECQVSFVGPGSSKSWGEP